MWEDNEDEEEDLIEPGSERASKLEQDFDDWNNGEPHYFSEAELEYLFRLYYQYIEDSGFKLHKIIDLGLSLFPHSGFFQTCQAKVLMDKNQFDNALESLDIASLLDPLNQEIAVLRAECYEEKNEYALALNILQDAESFVSEYNPDLQMRLASLLMHFERKNEAIIKLSELMKWEIKGDSGVYSMAFEIEDIVAAMDILIDKQPFESSFWMHKAGFLFMEEEYSKAYEAFEYAFLLDETNHDALFMMGMSMKEQAYYDQARKLFGQAIELGHDRDHCLLEIGICMNRLNDYIQARFMLQSIGNQDTWKAEILFEIGYSYLHEGLPYKALPFLENSRDENQTLITDILLSETYWQTDDLERIYELFESSKQLSFTDSELFYTHYFGLFYRMDDLQFMRVVADLESQDEEEGAEDNSLLQLLMRALILKAEGKNKLYQLHMYQCFSIDAEDVLYYLEKIDFELCSDPDILSMKELF